MILARLKNLRKNLAEADLDAIFIVNSSNVRYLSNYTGQDAYLFISRGRSILITDFRYYEQALLECDCYQIMDKNAPAPTLEDLLKHLCTEQGVLKLGFESAHTTYEEYDKLKNKFIDMVDLVPINGMIEEFRFQKDDYEIVAMQEACAATDQAFKKVLNYLKPGISEKDVARELLNIILKLGYDSNFPIIVASGNGSMLMLSQLNVD